MFFSYKTFPIRQPERRRLYAVRAICVGSVYNEQAGYSPIYFRPRSIYHVQSKASKAKQSCKKRVKAEASIGLRTDKLRFAE